MTTEGAALDSTLNKTMKQSARSLDVHTQVRFTDEGLEADTEVETDLQDWGIVEGTQERESRVMGPKASQFGVDDREATADEIEREQETLVYNVEADQEQLGGGKAGGFKW